MLGVPARLFEFVLNGDESQHRRKLVSFVLLMVLVCVVSLGAQWAQGVTHAMGGVAAMLVASLVALVALRFRASSTWVATGIVSVGAVIAALLALAAGRHGNLSVVWLTVVPLVATALGGHRAGWITLLVASVVIVAVMVGIEHEWLLMAGLPAQSAGLPARVTTLLTSTITIFLIARTYELETTRRIEQLDTQNRQLVEAQKVSEQASRARTQFLATISHELRTPLNGLIGMIEAMLEERRPERLSEGFGVLHSSADTLLSLINDVLDFTKIEAGAMALEQLPVSPENTLRTVVEVLGNRASERGTTLSLEVAPGTPKWVVGDPTRLRQISFNLVGNAIKFTERGQVRVLASWAGGKLSVAVSDTGVGMSDDTLSRLCAPFVQADASTTRKHGGTGLGLAITRRLVDLMGGTLSVVSRPGHGSTFTVELPFTVSEAPAPVAEIASTPTPLEVLVVDDNTVNQLVAQRLLERFGHHVRVVSNGAQALAAAATHTYDVVLMDCHMPVMDGYEATRELRRRGFQQPIFALTAAATVDDQAACVAAGMNRVLTKPLRIEQLKEALAAVAAQVRAAA
ncbi:MAG: ATP-binding protein [Myxococcaceae bacterium]